jgi:hypothetical protein
VGLRPFEPVIASELADVAQGGSAFNAGATTAAGRPWSLGESAKKGLPRRGTDIGDGDFRWAPAGDCVPQSMEQLDLGLFSGSFCR